MLRQDLHIVAFFSIALLFLAWLVPVTSAEDLRPAIHLGGNPAQAPANGYQYDAAVASDGVNHLVLWSDPRSGAGNDIYGVRVGPDGGLLDRDGLAISIATGAQSYPAVAFGAAGYLAAWNDDRSGSTDIYGACVAADGSVLDPAGIVISAATGAQGYPAVAYGDSIYLVAWADNRDTVTHIYGSRVALDGTVLDSAGIAICVDAAGQGHPAAAYDGANFLVVWEDSRGADEDIYGARVAPDGTVLDPGGVCLTSATGAQALPCVAFGETNYLVAWEDERSGISADIYGTRVGPDGGVIDSAGAAICDQSADQVNATVAFDGVNWLVAWNDQRGGTVWNLYAARIDSSFAVLETDGFAVCTDFSHQYAPAVACCDSVYLIAWHDSRNGPKDIYGARVAASGTVLASAMLVSAASSCQASPCLAAGSAGYLAVWQDQRLGTSLDIYGARVGLDETVLDANATAISTAAADQENPAAAFGGSRYLVAWQDYRSGASDIYGACLTSAGAVLHPSGFAISVAAGAQEYPAVASDGSGFLVVWQDYRSGAYDIYGARVSAAGTVLDASGFIISAAANEQARPAVTFDGANYLVIWQDYRSGAYDVYGARVTPAGAVLDASGIAISTAANAQECPSVAFDGTNSLVAWQDKRGGPYADIYAARVAPDGGVLDSAGVVVAAATYEQLVPAVAFEGTYYVVAWQDTRRTTTRPDIYAVRVDTAGVKIDASAFIISADDYGQTAPAVASGLPGQVVIGYTSYTHAPLYGADRIWARFYGAASGTPGTPGPDAPETDPGAAWLTRSSPNPFSAFTALRFTLAERSPVSVRVYDAQGRMVSAILEGVLEPGMHEVRWTGQATGGRRASPGLYWCRVAAGARSASTPMVLVD